MYIVPTYFLLKNISEMIKILKFLGVGLLQRTA